jgi:mRNA interferase MazF
MPIHRGEIYFIDFGDIRRDFGPEPTPANKVPAKIRPAVVLSVNAINRLVDTTILLVTVVPGTSGTNVSRESPWQVRVPAIESGLPRETVFRAFQINSLDSRWFTGRPAGRLSGKYLARLEDAVRAAILGPP